jgi:hypothetical protein
MRVMGEESIIQKNKKMNPMPFEPKIDEEELAAYLYRPH